MANNSYTSYHPDSYKGGANSVTVFAKNKTAAAKAATPNAGSSLGKGTLTSVNGKSVKNAAAIKKAIAQTGETNKIQKNSVKVVQGAKTTPNTPNPLKIKENFLSSISRAGKAGTGPSGKARDSRIIKTTGVRPAPLDNANTIKINSNPSRTSTLQGVGGVLGGQHAGGHSDVMGAINLGGFTVKTPVIKPTSTKNK
jgi:hypothetical protein